MASGLGRGLSSLIPQKTNPVVANKVVAVTGELIKEVMNELSDAERIWHILPDLIKVNPRQPRQEFNGQAIEELVESIREHGLLQPLVVTRQGDNYELIAGERRLRAVRALKLKTVPVIVREATDQKKLELALIENIQRENLNPVESALAYRQLADDFNLTQEQLAKRLGKPRSSIANSLRILNLPVEIQTALVEGRISEGHAKILIGLDSEVKQLNLFRKIVLHNLSVSQALQEVKVTGGSKQARVKTNHADADKENILREFFGAKAQIKRRGHGGQIILEFYSDEELSEIISRLK